MINDISKQVNSDIVSNENINVVVSDKDPMTINVFSDVISEIERSLSNLRVLALNTNFSRTTERQNYYDNITHLKRFYERGERILLNDNRN